MREPGSAAPSSSVAVRPSGRPRTAVARTVVRLFPCLLCAMLGALLVSSPPARAVADDGPQGRQNTPAEQSRAAYLAQRLREHPVYISDQLPRKVPRSARGEYHRVAQRAGVPTYVLVLPSQMRAAVHADRALLAAVHDELGRDGLYVLLSPLGVVETAAFGVDVPHVAAQQVALFELPYDAGALASFERFVEVVRASPEAAEERARVAAEERAGGATASHISVADRHNQSFVTGVALTGVPLAILLIGPVVRRHRARLRRLRAPAHPTGAPVRLGKREGRTGAAAPRPTGDVEKTPRMLPNRWEALGAAVVAGAILLGGTLLFDQTRTSPAPDPTAADMNARVARVAEGLREQRLYSDPESPRPLDAEQRSELRTRLAKTLDGQLRVAVVPSLSEDETAGDEYRLLYRLHEKVGEDGVYILADPYDGALAMVNYGVPIAGPSLHLLPSDIRDPASDDRSEDKDLARRLDALLTRLAESSKKPASEAPEPHRPSPAPDPVDEKTLPSLFATDFWPGMSLVGPLAAVLLTGLVSLLLAIWRAIRRGAQPPSSAERGGGASPAPLTFLAPPEPSLSWLRGTARGELDALSHDFETLAPAEGPLRAWAWDCLDAATLLADQDGDGRVDADAEPAALAAVIALARCARAGLGPAPGTSPGAAPRPLGTVRECCGFNPMHGPAVWGSQPVPDLPQGPTSAEGTEERRLPPLCASCQRVLASNPAAAGRLELTLPAPDGGRVSYRQVAGPLPSVQEGLDELVRHVKEDAGVR